MGGFAVIGGDVVGAATGLTLAITSSTGVMGLAVGLVGLDEVTEVVETELATERRHAEEISPRLQSLLSDAGIALRDLDRLVIDVGPGRFTGLRVGLATVRALGFGLGLPVIGLSSLATLAAGGDVDMGTDADIHTDDTVTAVIDARRDEVFQQVFSAGSAVSEPEVGPPELLASRARGTVVGDGLDRYLDLYLAAVDETDDDTGITAIGARNPSASAMLTLSLGRPGGPSTGVEPLYLREPDANPNIKTRVGQEVARA